MDLFTNPVKKTAEIVLQGGMWIQFKANYPFKDLSTHMLYRNHFCLIIYCVVLKLVIISVFVMLYFISTVSVSVSENLPLLC